MAIILNIDTAADTALVCLAEDANPLHFISNDTQKDHAAWIHTAISEVMKKSRKTVQDIDAFAVSKGPGSYTGLRVGLSTVKGLCYGLQKPLIGISTLELMAYAVEKNGADFICPVIDARRMEVFMAVYDNKMNEIVPPSALVVETNSFMTILEKGKTIFSGSAVNKLRGIIVHDNAIFNNFPLTAAHFSQLSSQYYQANKFENLAYTEPLYIKDFYSPTR